MPSLRTLITTGVIAAVVVLGLEQYRARKAA